MTEDFHSKAVELAAVHPAYGIEAYHFVSEAVCFSVERLPERRHVSALELLEGVRCYARTAYGAVAPLLLNQWGLRSASDIGNVVFLMIDAGLLAASPEDSRADFDIDFPLFDDGKEPDAEPRPEIPPIA